jgi:hypothetical protein
MSLFSWFAARRSTPRPANRTTLTLGRLEDRDVPAATVNLTQAGAAGAINGALFRQYTPAANAGPVDSFLRITDGSGGTEQGYNTDARPLQFDEAPNKTLTHSIKVSDLPLVTINGNQYRELLLDVNEPARQPTISLDELRVYVSNDPQLHGYKTKNDTLGGLNPVYDLGANRWVKIDASLNNQVGTGDVLVDIPANLLTGGTYLALYSKFGQHAAANGGYEEWGPGIAPAVQSTTISGFVFQDFDGDKILDNNDTPYADGWTVQLVAADGVTVLATAMTDSTGFYTLSTTLPVGTNFTLQVTPPGGSAPFWSFPGTITPGGTLSMDLPIPQE